jgi:hypothetical protein
VNEPGPASIDWASVLAGAHRRVIIRLGVLAAIGGVGAILLLGGGAATRAAIQDDGSGPPPPPPGPAGPDLTIASIESGVIRVENKGDADAGPFEVLAWIGEEEARVEPTGLASLAAGDSKDFRFECSGEEPIALRAEVRNADAAEGAEPEAERSEDVTCEGGGTDLPDLTISVSGNTAEITNVGNDPVGEFNVSAFDSEGAPVPVSPSPVGGLAPGDSESVTLECKEGSTVTVTVEPLEGGQAEEIGTCGEAPQATPSDGGGPGESTSGPGESGAEGSTGETEEEAPP